MGSTIKGITVQLGGDTVNLNKALKGVDNTSKNLQKELNLVNKELKFNPDNAVLLAQKHEILTDKINATREKLQKLNEVQEQVERQAKSGDLGADEYRAYQREVESTKSKLEHLESELGKTNDKFGEVQRKANDVNFNNAEGKVKSFKDKFKDMADKSIESAEQLKKKLDTVGDGLEKAGSVISKGSAAGAAVLAGSVASFKDLDNGYDIIVKKTGATNEKFDSLKKTADELFSGSTFDMTAIGNAVGEINTRFGFTDEKLKSVSESYLQFAKINDADVSDSVSKTARIMQAWNISSENIPDLLGMITAKSQETGVSADALMNKVLDNNSTFKEMDLSLEESISLMAQFERNGVNDSTALMALKTAVKNSAKEGEGLSDVLRKNVADIKNAKSDTEALQIATSLFGTRGAAEMANAIKEGRINFDDLSGSMSNYKSTVKDTYEGTLDPLEESKKGINNLKLAGAELASVALKEGEPLIEDVIDGVKGATEWLKKLTPEQKKTLAKTIEIVAVAGPAVTLAGKAAKGIGGIVSAATKVVPKLIGATAAQGGLNAAMDANPVGAVVLGITALIAALGGLAAAIQAAKEQRFEEIGFTEQAEKLQESVDKVQEMKDKVSNLKDEINNTMDSTAADTGMIDEYKRRLDELLSKADLSSAENAELISIGDWFKQKYPDFQSAWDKYIKVDDDGRAQINGNIDEIKANLDNLIEKYKKVASTNALTNLANKNTESYITTKQDVNKTAVELKKAQEELQKFMDDWGITEENLDSFLNEFGGDVWHTTANAEIQGQMSVSDLREQYQSLKGSVDSIQASYDELAGSAAQFKINTEDIAKMQAVVNGNYNDASAVMMAYNSGLITASDIEKSRWKSLDNLQAKAKETAEKTGSNLVFGVNGGVNKYINQVKEEGMKTASFFLEGVDLKGEMHSPSKAMYRRGVYFVQGFVNGLLDGSGLSKIWNASKSIASTALNSIKKFLGIASPSKEAEKIGDFFGVGLVNGIVKNKSAVSNAAQTLGESAKIGLSLDNLRNTYASLNKLKNSGIAQKSASVNNINNSSSRNINGGINITINNAKLDTDADIERFSEQLADTIIRKGMEWG